MTQSYVRVAKPSEAPRVSTFHSSIKQPCYEWRFFFSPQLRERLALLKIAEKEAEEEKRDNILKSKVVSTKNEPNRSLNHFQMRLVNLQNTRAVFETLGILRSSLRKKSTTEIEWNFRSLSFLLLYVAQALYISRRVPIAIIMEFNGRFTLFLRVCSKRLKL